MAPAKSAPVPAERVTLLERIRKLINLAASTNQKEAERAAYKACALIRDHGLDVCDPEQINVIYREKAAVEKKVKELESRTSSHDDDDIVFVNLYPPATSSGYAGFQTNIGTIISGGPGYTPSPSGYAQPVYASPPPMQPRAMLSHYAGQKCFFCSKTIQVNDPILWLPRGQGIWCDNQQCYPNWQARMTYDPFAQP